IDYLDKSERLSFSDELMVLDSNIYSKGIIDIDFKDRGIVEYFVESLIDDSLAYKIKIRVSQDEAVRKIAVDRLKKILVR
ncbi:MAG: YkgJ family cysteine cluster protein, partial [Romboutsia sp.]